MLVDTRTILLLNIVTGISFGMGLLFVSRGYLREINTARRWAYANLLQAVACLAFALRGHVPDIASILTGNGLLLCGYAWIIHLLCEFSGKPLRWRFEILAIGLTLAGLAVYSVYDNLSLRAVLFSVAIIFILVRGSYQLWARRTLKSYQFVLIWLGVGLAGSIARGTYYGFIETQATAQGFATGYVSSISFFCLFATSLTLNYAYLILCQENILLSTEVIETALADSQAYIDGIAQDSPAPMFLLDPISMRSVFVNDAFEKITGYNLQDLSRESRNITEKFFAKEDADRRIKTIKALAAKGGEDRAIGQYQLKAKGGGILDFIIQEKVIKRDTQGIAELILGFCTDVTKLKQTEIELRKAKTDADAAMIAKSQFIANISHEIRTPLNGIVGMANMLAARSVDAEQRRYIQVIEASSQALFSVINDTLDFSKIEAGAMELEKIPVALPELLNTTLQIALSSSQKSVPVKLIALADEFPEYVVTDPGRLRQVFLNLLSNALKFTSKGQIEFVAKLLLRARDSATVEFAVIDTGVGIPQASLKNLFVSFSQVDASVTRKYGGTGLGLAISSRLVKMLGGELEVESKEGKGTKFSFTLTFNVATGQPQQEEIPAQSALLANEFPHTIMVAEDNAINRMVIEANLEKLGYAAEFAHDGIAALDLARTKPFDIIFMDLQMPRMDGLTVTRKLIAQGIKAKIYGFSANAATEDRRNCADAGMVGFLPKPFSTEQLVAILKDT